MHLLCNMSDRYISFQEISESRACDSLHHDNYSSNPPAYRPFLGREYGHTFSDLNGTTMGLQPMLVQQAHQRISMFGHGPPCGSVWYHQSRRTPTQISNIRKTCKQNPLKSLTYRLSKGCSMKLEAFPLGIPVAGAQLFPSSCEMYNIPSNESW